MIIADGIESDDSSKDLYQPENTDLMQMDSDKDEVEVEDDDESDGEVENEDGCENKEVVSKKGKRPSPNQDAIRLQPFKPLFLRLDLNQLLNTQSAVSRAQGQFHGIHKFIVCTNILNLKPSAFIQETQKIKPAAFRPSFWLGRSYQIKINCTSQ